VGWWRIGGEAGFDFGAFGEVDEESHDRNGIHSEFDDAAKGVVKCVKSGGDEDGDDDESVFAGGEESAEGEEIASDTGPDRVQEGKGGELRIFH